MGGFGAPDRGGSRESKNSSLRANKKNAAKALKDGEKPKTQRPTVSERPPAALPPEPDAKTASIVDAGAQLASRQFDRDQQKVLQRAGNCGVGPILTYTTDDSKLEALVRTAKENAGAVYCMLGVHSDNIKRANDRLAPARLESLKDLALEGCCVAVMAGLAFRDVGIRYAQERALSEQMELAAAIALPLVLYEVRASEALVERIAEFRASGAGEGRAAATPIAIFNFTGSEDELRTYLALGCYIVLTGRVCDQTEKGERLRELAATIPADRLILASDSPFATPQNIDDVFMREGRNEPSNLPYLLTALAAALGLPEAQLAAATRRNALTFFGIREAAEAAEEAAAAEAAEAAAAGMAAAAGAAEAGPSGSGAAAPAAPAAPAPAGAKTPAGKGGKAAAAATAADEEEEVEVKSGKGARRGKKGGRGVVDSSEEDEGPAQARSGGARRRGGAAAAAPAGDAEEAEEDDGEELGLALAKQRRNKAKKGKGKAGAGKAANAFAQLRLQEGEGEGGDGSGAEQRKEDGEEEEDQERQQASEEREEEEGASQGEEDEDGDGAEGRGASGAGASTSSPAAATAAARARRPAPRNFVAEYEAAAAAKGPATGPRVSYSCRGCRSVLFTEADTFPHQDDERAVFAATKPRNKKGRGKKGGDDGGDGLCSMHFLSHPLPWMQSCMQSEGGRLGEGRLDCPTCAAKLGKWAAGPGSEGGGVACSCGVLVPAPAFAVMKARLDIVDSQLDIASAVQSSLKAYEEEEAAGSASSSSDDDGGGKKKRQKQKRNKTANFSSFRNKNFGFRLKDQKAIAETVAGGGMGAVKEEGEASD
ncbi:hypothetical protein CHLRE_10g429601v5 [Chlamydomonas reinhardtii]|uniref:TatD related DNase n=1 Tax=Chlamydomonas reinhardtii TaxID=3055 RepID=A0A2K3D9S7_CHLRE|nr:uncharacterized protein CHLRE_10g429601v5 [Chlamydomonas reinhardtii]PNW77279.1 hypothetical protein CHLRE_10g429601v5 [Chlamydomonas reinhardtii]